MESRSFTVALLPIPLFLGWWASSSSPQALASGCWRVFRSLVRPKSVVWRLWLAEFPRPPPRPARYLAGAAADGVGGVLAGGCTLVPVLSGRAPYSLSAGCHIGYRWMIASACWPCMPYLRATILAGQLTLFDCLWRKRREGPQNEDHPRQARQWPSAVPCDSR